MADFLSYLLWLGGAAVGITWPVWALRRKYEVDYELDRKARVVRWGMIGAAAIFCYLPGDQLGPVRLVGGIMVLAFLARPNFAYHITGGKRRDDGF